MAAAATACTVTPCRKRRFDHVRGSVPAKRRGRGGAKTAKTRAGTGTRLMLNAEGDDAPIGTLSDSASPAEATVAEPTLERVSVSRKGAGRPRKKPERVSADEACDADERRKRPGVGG
jgi:hypothetical protein